MLLLVYIGVFMADVLLLGPGVLFGNLGSVLDIKHRKRGCRGRVIAAEVWAALYMTVPRCIVPLGTVVAPVVPREIGTVVYSVTFYFAVEFLGGATLYTMTRLRVEGPVGE